MKAVAKAGVSIREIEAAAERYKELLRKQEQLEKDKKAISEFLKEQCLMTEDGKITVGLFKISLVNQTRESFDLKQAKEKLDLRVLKPFIKQSEVTFVRVS